jgi:hypothetical protein
VATDNERDARERRVSEQYTKAADQLGSDKAPVRMAGLYALERLANSDETQRQPIVNLFCAYLRMPFVPLDREVSNSEVTEEGKGLYRARQEEREVRLAVQQILFEALSGATDDSVRWPNLDLNLTGAYLEDFDFSGCQASVATFDGAIFEGTAYFSSAEFVHIASFDGAHFNGPAKFQATRFYGDASFRSAYFNSEYPAVFDYSQFNHLPDVSGLNLRVTPRLEDVTIMTSEEAIQRTKTLMGWAIVSVGAPGTYTLKVNAGESGGAVDDD